MVKIIWHDQALQLLHEYIEYALAEFGKSTALRWKQEISVFEKRVLLYPESYTPEPLLRGAPAHYRFRHLMNRRFKLIHYYDEESDTIHVVDIWDTRMKPETLKNRIG